MDYNSAETAAAAAMGIGLIIYTAALLVICVLIIAACWKIFTKAGKPGWASIIPFYNAYVLFDIAMGKGILFLLTCVPIVGYVVLIVLYYKLACAFGKGVGYTLGLIFLNPIFLMMLAFGDADYIGPQ